MAAETPGIFKGREELVEKVFNWDHFYAKGLGDSEEYSRRITNYEKALQSFNSFKKVIESKFNDYEPGFSKYLVKEGILSENEEGSPFKYSLTEFGMACVKSYFKWQVKKDEEIKDNKTLVSLLEEKGILDKSGKLDNKKFEDFYNDFEENQNN